MMLNLLIKQRYLRELMDSGLGRLFLDLSTLVHSSLWITVYKWSIKALELFFVDSRCIRPPAYPQVIHTESSSLKLCNNKSEKKKLDRLSTYPQSLLLLLNYKIS